MKHHRKLRVKCSLQRVLKPLHMRYAQQINRAKGWKGHLWQGRFFSAPLDEARKKGNAEIITLLEQAGAKSSADCYHAAEGERKTLEALQPSLN